MLLKRSVTAIILISFVIGMVVLSYFFGHVFLDLLILFFALTALFEMYRVFSGSGYKMFKTPLIFEAFVLYPVYYLLEHFKGIGMQGLFLSFVIACVIALTLFTFSKDRELKDLLATVFAMVYPFLFLSAAFVLSSMYSGAYSILFAVFLPVACDSFAYWVGSTVKGRKLCPEISPHKTVSGAIGGLFGGILAAVVFFFFFEYFNVLPEIGYEPFTDTLWKSALIYVALGIAGAAVSQIGDIVASKIKRQLNVKDYGNIFPGHGGSMDRVDSIMFSLVFLLTAFTIIY